MKLKALILALLISSMSYSQKVYTSIHLNAKSIDLGFCTKRFVFETRYSSQYSKGIDLGFVQIPGIWNIENDFNVFYKKGNSNIALFAGPGLKFNTTIVDNSWYTTEGWLMFTFGAQIFPFENTPSLGVIMEGNFVQAQGVKSNFGIILKLK